MLRPKYSQKQADRMLKRGRIFYFTDTPAAVIVSGREGDTVVYGFLDDPAPNRNTVRELRLRIKKFEDLNQDYLKKVEGGCKMRNGSWISQEEQKREAEEDLRRALAYIG